MVDPVARISASAATLPTQIDSSLSIDSEPDNAWVAARQEQITQDQHRLSDDIAKGHARNHPPHAPANENAEEGEEQALSGESDRIGTQNFDEDTPFGDRVVII